MNEMTIEQLKDGISNLATAHLSNILYIEPDGNKEAKKFRAIVNNKTNAIEAIASDKYSLIQHAEAFGVITRAMEITSKDSKFFAKINEQNGRAWLYVTFTDITTPDDKEGVMFGISASNSYDTSSSLRYFGNSKDNSQGTFQFLGTRQRDLTNMIISVRMEDVLTKEEQAALNATLLALDTEKATLERGKENEEKEIELDKKLIVPEEKIKTCIRHYGKTATIELNRACLMVLALPAVAKHMGMKINTMRKKPMTWIVAEPVMKDLGFGERATKKIGERFKIEEQTMWGLFCAIAAHATHDEKISPLSMERTLKQAEKLLK